ncbi:MAG: hypothetical protein MHPSP_000448, partial [Paramarteilia canceri]
LVGHIRIVFDMPALVTVSDGKRSHSSDGEQRSKSAKCFDEDDNEQMRVVKRGQYYYFTPS